MQQTQAVFNGFSEVYEIVPDRVYEVVYNTRRIRIYIGEVVVGPPGMTYQAIYDELNTTSTGDVWHRLSGVPHIGASPNSAQAALRQAASWLLRFLEV